MSVWHRSQQKSIHLNSDGDMDNLKTKPKPIRREGGDGECVKLGILVNHFVFCVNLLV
jgi:hypothetical protein